MRNEQTTPAAVPLAIFVKVDLPDLELVAAELYRSWCLRVASLPAGRIEAWADVPAGVQADYRQQVRRFYAALEAAWESA